MGGARSQVTANDGGFNGCQQHFNLLRKVKCLDEAASSDLYTVSQRAEIWDRWQRGESMSSIGRMFDRRSSSVFSVISPTGGIRPADRKRGSRALSLAEREEISRGLSVSEPLRAIARRLGRSPSTISREVRRNGGVARYRATASDQAAWDRALHRQCRSSCAANGHRNRLRGGSGAAFPRSRTGRCRTRPSTAGCT